MPQKGEARLTVEQIHKGIDKYFTECDTQTAQMVAGKTLVDIRKPYSMEGLIVSLNEQYGSVGRSTVFRWLEGGHPQDVTQDKLDAAEGKERKRLLQLADDNEFEYSTHTPVRDALSRASDKAACDVTERALLNMYNPKIASLVMAKHGYEDTRKVDHGGEIRITMQGVSKETLQDYSG